TPPLEHFHLFPYTTLFRSLPLRMRCGGVDLRRSRRFELLDRRRIESEKIGELSQIDTFGSADLVVGARDGKRQAVQGGALPAVRSEEHTSELQSRSDLVCR